MTKKIKITEAQAQAETGACQKAGAETETGAQAGSQTGHPRD